VLTFRLGVPSATTSDPACIRLFAELTSRLAALPGVESAAAISALPGTGSGGFHGVLLEGDPEPSSVTESKAALYRMVTPGFFDTLRIPLKAGRLFDPSDDQTHPQVAIVDERFAALHFPGRSPLGQRFRRHGATSGGKPDWIEIVGVVGNTRRHFDRDESNGTYYVPHAQRPTAFMALALRVRGDPASYIAAARKEVLTLNPDIPIYDEMPLTRSIARSDEVWLRRFFGTLFGAFAGVALLLASIGIYGVMAYAVAQRTHEIGIRMALGASPRDVLNLITRQGARLVVLGLVIGLVASYFLARLLAGNLYGISPHDVPTFALVLLLLAAIALLACLVPARRAANVDPILALRAE
jgi:putative ABC transport system permease protein